jgi:hypothetical protein
MSALQVIVPEQDDVIVYTDREYYYRYTTVAMKLQ